MENKDTNITVNNVDISKINELIEKESGFIDLHLFLRKPMKWE